MQKHIPVSPSSQRTNIKPQQNKQTETPNVVGISKASWKERAGGWGGTPAAQVVKNGRYLTNPLRVDTHACTPASCSLLLCRGWGGPRDAAGGIWTGAPCGGRGDPSGALALGTEGGGTADPAGHRFGEEIELKAPGRGGAPGLGFPPKHLGRKAEAGGWPRVPGRSALEAEL